MPEVGSELYKLISVSGTDAVEFLQGQLTQDVTLVGQSDELLAAWCNPKGRVIVIAHLVQLDGGIGLVVPASMAERVVQRLTMYRLRSNVEFTVSDTDGPDTVTLIRGGVPTIDDTNTESFTPHMLNLDKLDAISFTKGCYTGQEVVARTENLGKSKRRLMHYEANKEGIAVGDKLSDNERNVGEVVNVAGRDFLAVTPMDLHDRPLVVNGTTVNPQGLPYEL